MNVLMIKHRKFEVLEIIKDDVFKCEYKNAEYFIKKYNLENSESRALFQNVLKIAKSGVSQAKLFIADKKTGYIAKKYLEGMLMSDYILDHDFDENIYKQIFLNSYMARVAGINLDFRLDSWMLVDSKLYYVGDYCEKYEAAKDFTKTSLSQWFLSKDLAKYYEKNGVLFDKSRIKEEFLVNKEMVLMTCKYYQ